MLLSEDHRAVQDAVRAYVQDRIAPKAAQWDRDCHFPKDELRGLAALGCYGVAVGTTKALMPFLPAALSVTAITIATLPFLPLVMNCLTPLST